MRFAEALAEVETGPGRACKLARFLAEADDDDRKGYEAAVARRVPGARIAEAFRRAGFVVSPSTVTDHIGGRCCCE